MWLHYLFFNLIWLALVILGDGAIPLAVIWLVVYLKQVQFSKADFLAVFIISGLGIAMDSLLTLATIFNFENSAFIPLWLATLWLCFVAMLLRIPLLIKQSVFLQIAISMVFPPLSYFVGAQLSAVNFGWPVLDTLLLLALIWSIFFIFSLWLHRQLILKERANVS